MFTIHDIDDQITIFATAAEDLEDKATRDQTPLGRVSLFGCANGLREAARSLERMIECAVEAQAREALR